MLRRVLFALCALFVLLPSAARAEGWLDMISLSGLLETDVRFNVEDYRGPVEGEGYNFAINRNDAILHAEIRPHDSLVAVFDGRLRFYGFNTADDLPGLSRDRNQVDPFSVQVDQAYVATRGLPWSWLDLKAGRMVQTWGSADVFNQVDLLNPHDFYDPMDYVRKVPNQMFEVDVYPADWLTLTAVWIPVFKPALLPPSAPLGFAVETDANGCLSSFPAPPLSVEDNQALADLFASVDPCSLNFATPQVNLYMPKYTFADSQVGARAKFSFETIDFALTYYYGRFPYPIAYNAAAVANPSTTQPGKVNVDYVAEVMYPRMQVAGLDFSYTAPWLFDVGIVGELAVIFPEQVTFGLRAYQGDAKIYEATSVNVPSTPFIKATFGMDYTFTKWLYVNAMYLRGFFDEFNDAYGVHNYVVATAELKFRSDSLKLRLAGILNVDDLSNVANPQLTWVITPGLEALVGAFIFGGKTTPSNTYDYAAREKFGQKAAGRSFAYLKVRFTF
ncbi:MAG: hypothetical protein IT380_15500 [Myxococcales bacterium]|nr:hypothetical protein [Myxococcales bacterium]